MTKAELVERYNSLIDLASNFLIERVGLINQLAYLDGVEDRLASRKQNYYDGTVLIGKKLKDIGAKLEALKQELESGDDAIKSEYNSLMWAKSQLESRLKSLNKSLETIDEAPELVDIQRVKTYARIQEVDRELAHVGSRLLYTGTILDKYTKERVFKGRGLTSPDAKTLKNLAESVRRYKVTEDMLSDQEEDER